MGRGKRLQTAASPRETAKSSAKIIQTSIDKNIGKLHREWNPSKPDGHNVFLESIAPQMAQGSRDSRALTSRLGFALEAITNDLAAERYPGHVQSLLVSSSLSEGEARKIHRENPVSLDNIGWKKTVIWSRYNQKAVSEAASELTRYAERISKIGQPGFRKKLLEKFQEIRSAPKATQPWKVEVDLACIHPDIGIVEIKSGGELDKTKAESETKNLLEAYLAYGDMDVPVCYATLYSNNGEKAMKGALPKYFSINNDLENQGGLLVGPAWWEKVLPPDTSFDNFLAQFKKHAAQYEIKPYSE